MSYANITNPANFQLQDFAQFGFRVITTDFIPVPGEQYRTLYVLQDAVVTATTQKGDDITSKAILAGTLLHGLFNSVSITSGRVLAYAAGRVTAEEIIALYEAYVIALGGTLENAQCAIDTINEDGVDFFADASLVMIPEGYATGVVYGQRPLTSDSQLTFTRASDATRVGPDGAIEKVRTNLFQFSEQLSNAYWGKTAAGTALAPVITDNFASAPDGSNTAERAYFNAVGTSSTDRSGLVRQLAFTTGQTYTISVYAKSATGANQILQFRLCGSQVGSEKTVTNNWQRFTETFTATTSITDDFGIQIRGNNSVNTSDLILWGFQLELSDVMTNYIQTTTTPVSVGILSNVPRIDYTGGGCGKLLLEPQRTNLVTFSEQMDNAVWTKSGCTATANNTISPSGYQDADEINMAAPDASLLRQIITVTASTAYTFSFYVKRGTATNLRYNVRDITNSTDITAKVDYTSQTSTTQWNRISVTFTTPVGCTSVGVFPNRDSSSAGTFYIWGAQLEVGSYATSYIPTLGSSVTRLADFCSKTGISNLIGQTDGTLFVEADIELNSATGRIFIDVNDNNLTNRVLMNISNNVVGGFVSGSTRVSYTIPAAGRYKIAFAYKSGDFALYVNGVQRSVSSASVSFSGMNQLFLGHTFNTNDTQPVDGIKSALLFRTRLTNEQLQKLTTL